MENTFLTELPGYLLDDYHPLLRLGSIEYYIDKKISNRFVSTDNLETYESNLKSMPLDWEYRNKEILYQVNSSGYRTKEFNKINWQNSIVLFGCSNVFGVGVGEDETISHYLSKLLKKSVINLGHISGSNESILHLSSLVFKNYGVPYGVAIIWTGANRFRVYDKNGYADGGSWTLVDKKKPKLGDYYLSNYFEMLNATEETTMIRNHFFSLMAKNMWQGRCKFATGTYFEDTFNYTNADFYVENDKKARDLMHPGKNSHKEVANKLAEIF